ncbi:hypothetical protein DFH09DRAFT_1167743 [Mycena vulgaris]|nr:hypothetical protein DFH09DRAFT_1167743 [Mycena vulgaris]
MTSIPQELINAIVGEVDDTKSLKACALSASGFREPSQRILLRLLHLDNDPPNYGAVCTLLTASPHIGPYVTTLSIGLSSKHAAASHAGDLQQLLATLTKVRRCIIRGHYDCRWDRLASVAPVVGDFVQRQNLTELHLQFLDIPLPVLAFLLTCAPTLSFYRVQVRPDLGGDELPTPSPAPSTSIIRDLALFSLSETIADALLRPEFAFFTENIRTLRYMPLGVRDQDRSRSLISIAARTIERISLQWHSYHGGYGSPIALLTSLRLIDLHEMPFSPSTSEWLVYGLYSLFASSPPTLEEIRFACNVYSGVRHFRPEIMAALRQGLENCPAAPRICWRVNVSGDERQREQLDGFAMFIRAGLPTVHEEGRLFVQPPPTEEEDEVCEWAMRDFMKGRRGDETWIGGDRTPGLAVAT